MGIFNSLFDLINKFVFGPFLNLFMKMTSNNFALSIFLFTLAVNIILIPLSIKSQKASVQQMKIKPKLDELKAKFGDDKKRYQEEMQKLYQKENVSMGGGCLPMIIRFILIMSVYYLVIAPLTYLANVPADVITAAAEKIGKTGDIRKELFIVQEAGNIGDGTITEAVNSINFKFFGIDLTGTPHFSFDFTKADLLWIIPFLAFATALLSGIISMIMQKKLNPDAPSMAFMMLTMPLISLFISFNAPAGLGFYWACSSLIGCIIQTGVQQFYGPHRMIANENAKMIIKRHETEKQIISKAKESNAEE